MKTDYDKLLSHLQSALEIAKDNEGTTSNFNLAELAYGLEDYIDELMSIDSFITDSDDFDDIWEDDEY